MCGDSYVKVLKHKRHRARATYRCTGCNTFIKQGTRYNYAVAIVEGDFKTAKFCDSCWDEVN